MIPLLFLVLLPSYRSTGEIGTDGRTAEGALVAYVETRIVNDPVWIHGPATLEISFGVERTFRESALIPLFPSPLDVPVQIEATWLDGNDDWQPMEGPRHDSDVSVTFALGENTTSGVLTEVTREDRVFDQVTVALAYRARTSGAKTWTPPQLRLAYATEFRESFLHGKVPVDRNDVTVSGPSLSQEVRALPDERPDSFLGAVGRFTMTRAVDPSELMVGETLEMRLEIATEGPRSDLIAPRFDDLLGFHRQGATQERQDSLEIIRTQLIPMSSQLVELPAFEWSFFDPIEGRFERLQADAIPITVHPNPEMADVDLQPVQPEVEVAPKTEKESDPETGSDFDVLRRTIPIPVWGVALIAIGFALLWWRRSRPDASAPTAVPASAPATRSASSAPRSSTVPTSPEVVREPPTSDPILAAIAQRLGCPEPAVVRADLRDRLIDHGVDVGVADRVATLLEERFASRYGGSSVDHDAELRKLTRKL